MRYNHRTLIHAPLTKVARFFQNPVALRWLTPPPLFVQFHQVQPLNEGSLTDFTLWIGPMPIRWLAVHSEVHPLHGFTDRQVRGPFKQWVHRHTFLPVGEDATEVIDEIQAELSQNPLLNLVGRFMWLNLPLLFAYRGWRMRRALRTSPTSNPF
jgi:ligand-binding SRPBCC domain-containing protein